MSQEAQQRESKLPIKVVIVGDGSVGKTCLAQTFVHNAFPDDYTPTVFENMNKNMVVDGQEVFMELQDTAGQEEYEEIRKFGYSGAKVIIVGFAVNDQTTFENIKGKWLPELRDHAPEAKLLLVGTKSDLRTQKSKMSIKRRNRSARGKMVTIRTIESYTKKEKKFVGYYETSAKERPEEIGQIFEDAIRVGLGQDPKSSYFQQPKDETDNDKNCFSFFKCFKTLD